MKLTKEYLNDLTYEVIGAAIEVHRVIGPGLLESVYEKCFAHELKSKGINFKQQQIVPIQYKNVRLEADLRYDFLIEECLVVELKAVLEWHPVFEAQTLTYMSLLQVPKGLIINFTCSNIVHKGQRTLVNELFQSLPES